MMTKAKAKSLDNPILNKYKMPLSQRPYSDTISEKKKHLKSLDHMLNLIDSIKVKKTHAKSK